MDATKEINEIEESEETRLYAERPAAVGGQRRDQHPRDARKILSGQRFLETDKPQIEIKLHLIKHGGLKLDI